MHASTFGISEKGLVRLDALQTAAIELTDVPTHAESVEEKAESQAKVEAKDER